MRLRLDKLKEDHRVGDDSGLLQAHRIRDYLALIEQSEARVRDLTCSVAQPDVDAICDVAHVSQPMQLHLHLGFLLGQVFMPEDHADKDDVGIVAPDEFAFLDACSSLLLDVEVWDPELRDR